MKVKCPFCRMTGTHTRGCNGASIPDPKKVRARRAKRKEYEERLMKRGDLGKYDPDTKSWKLPNVNKNFEKFFDLKQGLHGKYRKIPDGGSS